MKDEVVLVSKPRTTAPLSVHFGYKPNDKVALASPLTWRKRSVNFAVAAFKSANTTTLCEVHR